MYQQTDSDIENYLSVRRQIHYDVNNKNNKISLKVLTYIITTYVVSQLVTSDSL